MRHRRYASPKGLHTLNQLGVDHKDVNGGNVHLSTDPEKAVGIIFDLDLSSTSEEAIKAACSNDYDTNIKEMTIGSGQRYAIFISKSNLEDFLILFM